MLAGVFYNFPQLEEYTYNKFNVRFLRYIKNPLLASKKYFLVPEVFVSWGVCMCVSKVPYFNSSNNTPKLISSTFYR